MVERSKKPKGEFASAYSESLLTSEHHEMSLTPEQLSELFVKENIEDVKKGEGVSVSLHTLEMQMRGVQGIAQTLQTDLKTGIQGTQQDIDVRTSRYGTNMTKPRTTKTFGELVMECFEDHILQILIAAAAVSLIVGVIQNGWQGLIEGTSILISILIITAVTSINNYVKERQFQALQKKSDSGSAIVVRGGSTKTVPFDDLVVGDIITIETGKTVPADCVLINSADLVTNESTLTGETEPNHKLHVTAQNYKSNPNAFLLKSTLVESGTGKAIVCAVGENTQAGKAEKALDIEDELTPLQRKLDTIANQIGMVGFYVAIFTFSALVIKLLITTMMAGSTAFLTWANLSVVLNAFIIAVTIIVVAVPEGLPLAVTISLAFSVQKMFQQNNLVRRLHASETMGGANEICSDKTGTLTQNRMTVQAVYMGGETMLGDYYPNLQHSPNSQLLAQSVVYNCTAHVETEQNGLTTAKGNVTEVGLLKYLLGSKVDVETLIAHKDSDDFIVFQIPFNSTRKRQTTAVRQPDGRVRVYVKGAPEIVIELCTKMVNDKGAEVALTEQEKGEFLGPKVLKQFASKCYRTLLVAYVDYTEAEWNELERKNNGFNTEADKEATVAGMTMVACFGLMDPLRPGIRDAVGRCHNSGINVRMVTGDNLDTAIAISREAGIVTDAELRADEEGYICMTGKNFREIVGGLVSKVDPTTQKRVDSVGNKRAFREVAKKLKVLARSSPEDKYLLVTGLKDEGAVVAVTGDGTNDAPALNRADVGFAMGQTGTDVAKNASDIVLTDDNFCSVLTAVKYGRNIYDSVRKFLQFQITVNLVALFIVFSGAILFTDPPLTAVQMLWVNLIMDTFAALALATEPPSDELFNRQPQSRFDKIVNPTMWRNIIGQGIYQIAVLLIILFFGQSIFALPFASDTPFYATQQYLDSNPNTGLALNDATNKCTLYTIVFQSFVFMQLFNQINARKLGAMDLNVFKGFFNNGLFIFIVALTFVVQIAMTQFGGQAVRTVPLTLGQNGICLAIGSLSLIWGVIIKLLLPPSWFASLSMNENEMTDKEESDTINAQLRRSFRQSQQRQSQRGPSQLLLDEIAAAKLHQGLN